MLGLLALSALEACGLVATSRDPHRTAFWLPPCLACCFAGSTFDVGGASVLVAVEPLPAEAEAAYRVIDADHVTDRIIDLARPADRSVGLGEGFYDDGDRGQDLELGPLVFARFREPAC